jgi:hypothetical protein
MQQMASLVTLVRELDHGCVFSCIPFSEHICVRIVVSSVISSWAHPFHDRTILDLPVHLLKIHYWYTRTTSLGINRTGIYLSGLADFTWTTLSFTDLAPWNQQFEFWLSFGLTAIICVWYTIPLFLALKVVSPIALVWNRWIPVGSLRVEPTHRERAFLRSDFRMPKLWLALVSGHSNHPSEFGLYR